MDTLKTDSKRELRQQKILEVSLDLFSKNGYHGVPVSLIAKEANMSKGLLYSYFKNKEDLLYSILQQYKENLEKELPFDPSTTLTTAQFKAFVYHLFDLLQQKPNYYKLIISLSFQDDLHLIWRKAGADQMPFNIEILRKYFISLGKEDPDLEMLYFASAIRGFFIHYTMKNNYHDEVPDQTNLFNNVLDRIIADFS